MDGNDVQFLFETDAIFARSSTGAVDRIYYEEISDATFDALLGYETRYVQMTFATIHGFRTYFYFPIPYTNIAKRVVSFCR
jgi:hypothetical protein